MEELLDTPRYSHTVLRRLVLIQCFVETSDVKCILYLDLSPTNDPDFHLRLPSLECHAIHATLKELEFDKTE